MKRNKAGDRFGKLTLIEKISGFSGNQIVTYWKCVCDCGTIKIVRSSNIMSGHTISCGCFRKEKLSQIKLKHGNSISNKKRTPEYNSWAAMKQRCYDNKYKQYKDYGGRGIKVCDRWLESFNNFLEDMGKKPSSNHSLDRIDVNGNYEPSNCRWATIVEQANNKRKNVFNSL